MSTLIQCQNSDMWKITFLMKVLNISYLKRLKKCYILYGNRNTQKGAWDKWQKFLDPSLIKLCPLFINFWYISKFSHIFWSMKQIWHIRQMTFQIFCMIQIIVSYFKFCRLLVYSSSVQQNSFKNRMHW